MDRDAARVDRNRYRQIDLQAGSLFPVGISRGVLQTWLGPSRYSPRLASPGSAIALMIPLLASTWDLRFRGRLLFPRMATRTPKVVCAARLLVSGFMAGKTACLWARLPHPSPTSPGQSNSRTQKRRLTS